MPPLPKVESIAPFARWRVTTMLLLNGVDPAATIFPVGLQDGPVGDVAVLRVSDRLAVEVEARVEVARRRHGCRYADDRRADADQ